MKLSQVARKPDPLRHSLSFQIIAVFQKYSELHEMSRYLEFATRNSASTAARVSQKECEYL